MSLSASRRTVHRSDRTVTDSRVIDASKFFTTLDANQRLKRERVLFSDTKCDARSEDEYSVLQINYPGSGNNSQFAYDGVGQRVKIVETTNGTITSTKQFIWRESHMCEVRDGSGSLTNQYFAYGQTISGSNYFYNCDNLASVRELTDNSGNIQAQYSYDPFGRATKIQGSLSSDFQFTNHYFHAPSGLSLTRTRTYQAQLGRWISRDPMEESAGLNLYDYVENDPVNLFDPYGQWHPDRHGNWCGAQYTNGATHFGEGNPTFREIQVMATPSNILSMCKTGVVGCTFFVCTGHTDCLAQPEIQQGAGAITISAIAPRRQAELAAQGCGLLSEL